MFSMWRGDTAGDCGGEEQFFLSEVPEGAEGSARAVKDGSKDRTYF